MSDIHNQSPVDKQINNPIIQGNLVLYGDRKVKRWLTGLPELQDPLIGREQELAELKRLLHESKSVVLMNGMGGIGKTTLALAYANLHKNDYLHIAWLEVAGDFATALAGNAVLLQNLDITKLSGSPASDVQLILNALANLGGTSLLILDDTNEQITPYKQYLPKDWHVLLTSRQELGFRHTLHLDFLSEDSARALFYTHYEWERDDATVNAILQAVGNHTLTVELLAKTAQRRRIKRVAELRDTLQARGLEIGRLADFGTLHSREQKIERIFPYLCAVFELNDKHLNDTERGWLRRLAMLPPSFIKLEEIATFFEIKEENTEAWDNYTATLASLHEKGWLLYDAKDDAYKMHQIIQEVARHYMPIVVVELNTLLKIMKDLVYVDTSTKDLVERFVWIPYAEHLLRLVPDEKQEAVMELQRKLGWLYQFQGNYTRAKQLLETAVRSSEAVFEPNHYKIGSYKNTLGWILNLTGEYQTAANYLEQALAIFIQHKGEADESVATAQSNLANVYSDLGEYERARDLLEKALASDLKNFGEFHPKVALRQSNLALVYSDLGEYERARDLLEKALASNLNNFGENHPQVALYQSNLASVYKNLGEYERARDLLEKALENALKNFGEFHPNVATRYNNLIAIYAHFKEWDKAQEASTKSLNIWLKTFGAAHPYTKIAEEKRAWLQEQQGEQSER
ncbi:MAG: tetratricopeptide repeat protein [Saprospiraceae bacterium]|nr:tetratricopeptide repeat protein [Saprospiraceae bacterium]